MEESKTKTINERFLLALQNMKDPIKDASAFKFSYSKLPQITGIIRPALQEQGLDFSQRANCVSDGDKQTFILETRIFDKDSEVILDRRPLCFTPDAQKSGSYETYMRRYALLTVFGLAPKDDEEDDDGFRTTPEYARMQAQSKAKAQSAKPKPKPKPKAQAETKPQPQGAIDITLKQAKEVSMSAVNAGIKATGLRDYLMTSFPDEKDKQNEFSNSFVNDKLETLTSEQLNKYITHCNTLIEDKKSLKEKGN